MLHLKGKYLANVSRISRENDERIGRKRCAMSLNGVIRVETKYILEMKSERYYILLSTTYKQTPLSLSLSVSSQLEI